MTFYCRRVIDRRTVIGPQPAVSSCAQTSREPRTLFYQRRAGHEPCTCRRGQGRDAARRQDATSGRRASGGTTAPNKGQPSVLFVIRTAWTYAGTRVRGYVGTSRERRYRSDGPGSIIPGKGPSSRPFNAPTQFVGSCAMLPLPPPFFLLPCPVIAHDREQARGFDDTAIALQNSAYF